MVVQANIIYAKSVKKRRLIKLTSFRKKTDDGFGAAVATTLGHRYIFGAFKSLLKRLICQSFSAFCASSLKNVSAVSSSHSFSEAVLFFSLSFFRLICSEHYCHLLGICSEACCFSAFFTLLHNDIIYYKHKKAILSSVLSNFFDFSSIYNAIFQVFCPF